MVKVEHDVVVRRPVEEVFAYLSEPANVPEWQSGVTESRRESDGPMAPGARWTEERTFLGQRFRSTLEATAYEPAREFSLKVVSGPFPFRVRHLFEPADGGTRIRVTGEGEPGGFFKLGGRFAARAAERMFQKDFETLKNLLEARGP